MYYSIALLSEASALALHLLSRFKHTSIMSVRQLLTCIYDEHGTQTSNLKTLELCRPLCCRLQYEHSVQLF